MSHVFKTLLAHLFNIRKLARGLAVKFFNFETHFSSKSFLEILIVSKANYSKDENRTWIEQRISSIINNKCQRQVKGCVYAGTFERFCMELLHVGTDRLPVNTMLWNRSV